MRDPFDLNRFITAQQRVYDAVVQELRSGRKRSHWMWFVFPQIAGLGVSATARRYGIQSLDEARAYYEHPTLGSRLRECTQLVLEVNDRSAEQIFGHVDTMKFRSSMTLFRSAAPNDNQFQEALDKYFDSEADETTLSILASES